MQLGKITVSNGKITGFIGKDKIYIGRKNRYYSLENSVLSNPYILSKVYSREQSIELYSKYLKKSLINNKDIKQEFDRLVKLVKAGENIDLVCYCKPLDCHGDVIKKMIKEIILSEVN